jgi:hypothetical protein
VSSSQPLNLACRHDCDACGDKRLKQPSFRHCSRCSRCFDRPNQCNQCYSLGRRRGFWRSNSVGRNQESFSHYSLTTTPLINKQPSRDVPVCRNGGDSLGHYCSLLSCPISGTLLTSQETTRKNASFSESSHSATSDWSPLICYLSFHRYNGPIPTSPVSSFVLLTLQLKSSHRTSQHLDSLSRSLSSKQIRQQSSEIPADLHSQSRAPLRRRQPFLWNVTTYSSLPAQVFRHTFKS